MSALPGRALGGRCRRQAADARTGSRPTVPVCQHVAYDLPLVCDRHRDKRRQPGGRPLSSSISLASGGSGPAAGAGRTRRSYGGG